MNFGWVSSRKERAARLPEALDHRAERLRVRGKPRREAADTAEFARGAAVELAREADLVALKFPAAIRARHLSTGSQTNTRQSCAVTETRMYSR